MRSPFMRRYGEILPIVEKRGHRLRRTLSARSARQRDLLELFLQMENPAWRADSLTQSFESQCGPLLQASAPEKRSSCSFLRSLNARDNKTSNFVLLANKINSLVVSPASAPGPKYQQGHYPPGGSCSESTASFAALLSAMRIMYVTANEAESPGRGRGFSFSVRQ